MAYEEWQRRKSVLIRSLFHDIPILSPVEEESEDSPQEYHPRTREPFPSPPRPYSPLPPLIIEKVPKTNKHDEPEEYYTKLHRKIKKIYVKLFLENRNLSSIGSNEGSVDEDELVHNDNVAVDSSDSVANLKRYLESISPANGDFDSISNGYGADFESTDTTIKDVENHTTSTEIVLNISEEEDSDSESFGRDDIGIKDSDNSRSSEHRESSRGRTDDRVPDEELISIIDEDKEDQEMTEIGKSKETEVEHGYEDEESSNEDIDEQEITEETNKTGDSDGERIDDPELEEDESRHSSINDQEKTKSKVSSRENEQQTEDKRRDKTETNSSSRDSETESKGGEKTASEGGNGDVETCSSSEDTDYRQITTIALVHFDGSKDAEDRESRVYEDSVRSAILPTRFRRVLGRRVDDEREVLAELEEEDDPKTGPSFNSEEDESATSDTIGEDIVAMKATTPEATEKEFEGSRAREVEDVEAMRPHQPETYEDEEEDDIEMESPHSIEQMRTPRPELSRGTMPVTHQSCSESSCEHITFRQEATMMTSSSKDGAEKNNSNLQTSNDMNDVLTSIFNESSQIRNGTAVSAKKRKFEEKSAQAFPMRVTWEEMRANFFVGTPKMFRLCDCTNHVCL